MNALHYAIGLVALPIVLYGIYWFVTEWKTKDPEPRDLRERTPIPQEEIDENMGRPGDRDMGAS